MPDSVCLDRTTMVLFLKFLRKHIDFIMRKYFFVNKEMCRYMYCLQFRQGKKKCALELKIFASGFWRTTLLEKKVIIVIIVGMYITLKCIKRASFACACLSFYFIIK